MNKFTLSLVIFGILILGEVKAQPQTAQWSFYLAFEDATGAMDSLWYVLDTSATVYSFSPPYHNGNDLQFGEVPLGMDSSFHVSMGGILTVGIGNGSSWPSILEYGNFKVEARPVGSPNFGGGGVVAHNYVLPITMRYDAALLTSATINGLINQNMSDAFMDNGYLFGYDDSGVFCLPFHDSLVLPYFEVQGIEADHFPISLNLTPGSPCAGLSISERPKIDVKIYPNPAAEIILIQSREDFDQVEIFDLSGKRVLNISAQNGLAQSTIDVSTLNSGMYVLSIHNKTGWGFAKFVKE